MIYLCGDTHIPLDTKKLNTTNFPEQKQLTKNDYVIVLGDFGLLWHNDKTYLHWLKLLNEKPFTTLWIDGNHENFDWINSLSVTEWNGGKVHKVSDSIIHLMRGQVFTIENNTFFTFGGARSIDRGNRVPHVSWWEQEEASYAEMEEAEDNLNKYNRNVDFILTHAIFPEIITPMFHTYNLKAVPSYSGSSEKYLSNIYQTVEFKQWYFGHYHVDVKYGKFNCLYNNIVPLDKGV